MKSISKEGGTAFVPVTELSGILALEGKGTVMLIFKDVEAKLTTMNGHEKLVALNLVEDLKLVAMTQSESRRTKQLFSRYSSGIAHEKVKAETVSYNA